MRLSSMLAALAVSACGSTAPAIYYPPKTVQPFAARVSLPAALLPNGETGFLATCRGDVSKCFTAARSHCDGEILVVDQLSQQIPGIDPGAPPQRPVDLSGMCFGTATECAFQRGAAVSNSMGYARNQREYEARLAASAPQTEYRVLGQCIAAEPPAIAIKEQP